MQLDFLFFLLLMDMILKKIEARAREYGKRCV